MASEKLCEIKVFIDDPNPADPKFRLECDTLPTNGDGDFVFNNNGHPGFLLRYVLQGNAHGYRFPDDGELAMYSAKGVGCPKNSGQWPQFTVDHVKPANKILVVRNLNEKGHEGRFGYTLRVTRTPHDPDTPADEYLELDPGGENNNGSWGFSSVNYAAVGTIGAVTGVVSALATTFALARFDLVCSGGGPGF